ncbi:MAG: microcin C transport system permease protein [Gammaproteobacteria bacterium]|jgi:microcin C transport system permease protein
MLNPITRQKLTRFCQIKTGYYSFITLCFILILCLGAELLVNNRAVIVKYEGNFYFPTYNTYHAGKDFGLDYEYETNYRELSREFKSNKSVNWVLMPLVPYGPNENNAKDNLLKASAPSVYDHHYFGTDSTGRDILARLLYGTRTALIFALLFMVMVYAIGVAIGCAMGYFGGVFDLFFQRLIEIWSNIPFLYIVIIVFSIIPGNFDAVTRITILLIVMVLFSWTSITYFMRTETYRQKSRDYVAAARVLGASHFRIVFKHIAPNLLATLITFMPFTIVGAITAITALDFLGFGLPPPTPSLGELLKQGTANLRTSPWIIISAFSTLVVLLSLITFIGEGLRESFDPKKFSVYR